MAEYQRAYREEEVQATAGATGRNTKTGRRSTETGDAECSGQNHRTGNRTGNNSLRKPYFSEYSDVRGGN